MTTARNRVGRPEVGPVIQVRLPADLLGMIDADAEENGLSRAEMIRRLLVEATGLSSVMDDEEMRQMVGDAR